MSLYMKIENKDGGDEEIYWKNYLVISSPLYEHLIEELKRMKEAGIYEDVHIIAKIKE